MEPRKRRVQCRLILISVQFNLNLFLIKTRKRWKVNWTKIRITLIATGINWIGIEVQTIIDGDYDVRLQSRFIAPNGDDRI